MDNTYWDNYYSTMNEYIEPSQFAKDILPIADKGKVLIELGCGNGRDALFFAKNGLKVVAVDQSKIAISKLQSTYANENIEFIADDFVHSNVLGSDSFNYAYSRFTMHSITEEEQDILLQKVYDSLKINGKLFIEVRSVKDDIYGLGEEVGRNAYYYNEHYRRFIVLEELTQKLQSIGFQINKAVEANNFAIYKDENPIVIRVIAQKML